MVDVLKPQTEALVLSTDPHRCHHNSGLHITINQNAVLTTFFNLVKEIQRDETSYDIPKDFQTAVHEYILKGMKMDLIKLPEGTVVEEELEEFARPFAESILAHPVVGTILLTLLTSLLVTGGGLMTYLGPRRFFAVMLTPCPCKRAQENRNAIGRHAIVLLMNKTRLR